MTVPNEILFFALLLFSGLVLAAVFQRFHVPSSLWYLIVGFLAALWISSSGYDLGLRWFNFRFIAFYMILPALVFTAALELDVRALMRHLISILILSIPVFLIMLLISAALLYDGIDSSEGFPWAAAFLTATILSATDPEEILHFCEKFGAPQRLILLIKGESLFNDAGSILIYGLVMNFASGSKSSWHLSDALSHFLLLFFGGILTGLAGGLILWLFFRLVKGQSERLLLILITVYAGFILSETVFNVSGVMTLLTLGIISNLLYDSKAESSEKDTLFHLWSFLAHLAHALVMILVGITIVPAMFTERWLAMLIGIIAVMAARAIGIYGVFPLFNFFAVREKLNKADKHILFLGSNRGAIAVALALSLPLSLDYWFTIQSVTYGVVLFGLLIQVGLTPHFLRRLFKA